MSDVFSVVLRKGGGGHVADVTMKRGHALLMSQVNKALAEANKAMGDKMGTKYVLSDGFGMSAVFFVKAKAPRDEAKFREALGKLAGFKSVSLTKKGFAAAFDGEKQATLAEVRKACGVEISDVVLATAKDGVRYACPTHPDNVSAETGKCPTCRKEMVEVQPGDALGKAAPADPPKKSEKKYVYKCSMDGATRATPGPCPSCGMNLGESDKVPQ